jgi:hypothetical protein
MDTADTRSFLFPSDRRAGIERRQFTYDVYIPERRLGVDRRRLWSMARASEAVEHESLYELTEELPGDRTVVYREDGE